MTPDLHGCEFLGGYRVGLTFADGMTGEVDFTSELWGEVFEPLKDRALFRRGFVHPELKTLCWPNGADLAPEMLYAAVRSRAASA